MTENRRKKVLQEIVKHFIQTGEPVGSKTLIVSYKFYVSPATIRNDMVLLEEEGYIFQPHTSAGRVPTDKGYRLYVDEMADYEKARKEAQKTLEKIRKEHKIEKVREHLYDTVSLLSRATGLVSFATTPDNPRTFFLGMSNVLKQPEFSNDMVRASEVIEVLEQGDGFVQILPKLNASNETKTFIGEENLIQQIQSCSIILNSYTKDGFNGYFGILGPKRMNYAYNISLVDEIKKLLDS